MKRPPLYNRAIRFHLATHHYLRDDLVAGLSVSVQMVCSQLILKNELASRKVSALLVIGFVGSKNAATIS